MQMQVRFVIGALVAAVVALMTTKAEAQQKSVFVGTRIGWNKANQDVMVKREVGSLAGYDSRWQAIAVARMAQIEPAVVVGDRNGRWHVLETTADFNDSKAAADNMWVRTGAFGLPSLKKPTSTDEEKLAVLLGVDANEVKAIASSSSREAKFVNVDAGLPERVKGLHGPERATGEAFQPGQKSAIEINRKWLLEHPREAAATFFHEATHKVDFDLAQTWMTKYQARGALYVRDFPGPWIGWMNAATGISEADRQTVLDVVRGDSSSTEMRAHLRAFLAALDVGAYDAATDQLDDYAGWLKGTQDTRATAVKTTMSGELAAAKRSLSGPEAKAWERAEAAARAANPNAWFLQKAKTARR